MSSRPLSLLPCCIYISLHTGPRAPTLCSAQELRARSQFWPQLLLLCSSHQPIGPQPYPAIYVVANPVRSLLDRENTRETSTKLQREHENKTKQKQDKNDKKKGTITQSTCQKKMEEGHSIYRVWYSASREPSDNLPGSQLCTLTHSIYNSVLSGFQVSL